MQISHEMASNTHVLQLTVSLLESSLEYLEFPLLKFNYFQYSIYLFPKVFSCQIS